MPSAVLPLLVFTLVWVSDVAEMGVLKGTAVSAGKIALCIALAMLLHQLGIL